MRQSVLVMVKTIRDGGRRKAMMMIPVSDALKDLLDRQNARQKTVGAVKPHAMKMANDLLDLGGDDDRSPSGGEEDRPKRLPRLRIVRALPFLAVIEGGRNH